MPVGNQSLQQLVPFWLSIMPLARRHRGWRVEDSLETETKRPSTSFSGRSTGNRLHFAILILHVYILPISCDVDFLFLWLEPKTLRAACPGGKTRLLTDFLDRSCLSSRCSVAVHWFAISSSAHYAGKKQIVTIQPSA